MNLVPFSFLKESIMPIKELRKQIWFVNQILTALKRQHHSQYSDILAKTEKLLEDKLLCN